MSFTVFNRYKDCWILTSSERVHGGGTIDAPPVRVVAHDDRTQLAEKLNELLGEDHPVVSEPGWNERRFKVGIRVEAVGLRSWRSFVKDARAFKLEKCSDGLVLEEWPKEGGSFSAKASWQKQFPNDAFEEVAEFLVQTTEMAEPRKQPTGKKTAHRR